MMKKYLNIFSLIIIVFIFISCSKEVNNNLPPQQIPTPNDRLVFQSFKEYYNTYIMLCKFHTEDELRIWAQSKNHSTLLDSQDSIINNYSGSLRTILNKDSEFEIGDSIVLFNKGDLYAYSKKESNKISLLDNPEKFKKIGAIRSSLVGGKEAKSVDIGANGNSYIPDQFDLIYYQPCGEALQGPFALGSAQRQFVSQLYDETTFSPFFDGPFIYSTLFLFIKLEEKTNSIPWRTCNNQREVSFHVSGSATYKAGGSSLIFTIPTITGVYSCSSVIASGPLSFFLAGADGSNMYGYVPSWTISVYGFISQHVLGDTKHSTLGSATFPYDQAIW